MKDKEFKKIIRLLDHACSGNPYISVVEGQTLHSLHLKTFINSLIKLKDEG